MSSFVFEAALDEQGRLPLPEEIKNHLDPHQVLRVEIQTLPRPAHKASPEWEALIERLYARLADSPQQDLGPYVFNRDELYDHLDKFDG
jgi:hypothetical protein